MLRRGLIIVMVGVFIIAGLGLPAIAEEGVATDSGVASGSARLATMSARVKTAQQKEDITQPTKPKNRLEQRLFQKEIKSPSWNNFLRYVVQESVRHGVPINTLVLILLLPLAGAIITTLRHVVGLRGLGIFTPTVLSVAFISTGIGVGLIIFFMVVFSLTVVRLILRRMKFRMQYLPRMALIMVFISLSIVALFFGLVRYTMVDIYSISIFPILIMMLLAESFMEVQIGRSLREAVYLTLQTLLIALLVYFVLTMESVQILMVTYPEAVILMVILTDIFVGKYVGLRILEYWRFRKLITSR
ncbi:MAG: hypothetical protein GXP43_01610 [bacterium]|nr:hypothetical protein [bacterium]